MIELPADILDLPLPVRGWIVLQVAVETHFSDIWGGSIDKFVSAADANREFSKIFRAVRQGQSFVVKSRGMAVARIVPAEANDSVKRGANHHNERTPQEIAVDTCGRWSREDLYREKP
jgi:prevent-host-death family protein